MTATLNDLIKTMTAQKYATDAGTAMHRKLQNLHIVPDAEIMSHIQSDTTLARLFDTHSQCEVPVAGYMNGKFISRRIDRLRIDDAAKKIDIVDYKTDVHPGENREQYARQLGEYRKLISDIYPPYTIDTYILWTHTWTLEKM